MKTSPSSLKIRQLIKQVERKDLILRPEFQRRLVWTSEDKIRFIDTLLKGYPFPEIYVANGETDLDTGEGTQLLIDGQQRMTTIVEYFKGDPSTADISIKPYSELSPEEKDGFLNYDVAIRDLGPVSTAEIIEVFKRINSTKYSLNDIEINNAVYAGELMRFVAGFAEHSFFDDHRIFKSSDIKRMGDVKFLLQTVITMISGYFNRDDNFEEYLQQYNDSFPLRSEIASRLLKVFDFMDECGFHSKSRVWKKADLFTAIVEIDSLLSQSIAINPSDVVEKLQHFYSRVDDEGFDSGDKAVAVYAKSAIQASNDRINRIRRGLILSCIMTDDDPLPLLGY